MRPPPSSEPFPIPLGRVRGRGCYPAHRKSRRSQTAKEIPSPTHDAYAILRRSIEDANPSRERSCGPVPCARDRPAGANRGPPADRPGLGFAHLLGADGRVAPFADGGDRPHLSPSGWCRRPGGQHPQDRHLHLHRVRATVAGPAVGRTGDFGAFFPGGWLADADVRPGRAGRPHVLPRLSRGPGGRRRPPNGVPADDRGLRGGLTRAGHATAALGAAALRGPAVGHGVPPRAPGRDSGSRPSWRPSAPISTAASRCSR